MEGVACTISNLENVGYPVHTKCTLMPHYYIFQTTRMMLSWIFFCDVSGQWNFLHFYKPVMLRLFLHDVRD